MKIPPDNVIRWIIYAIVFQIVLILGLVYGIARIIKEMFY